MKRLALLLVCAAILAAASPVHARLSRSSHLDSDFKNAAVAMIGTIESVGILHASAPGPFSSTVQVQELRVRVDVALRNSTAGQLVRVRHPLVLPSSGAVINGFSPAVLRKQRTYLFFLKRTRRGLELMVVEDHKLVEFARRNVRATATKLRHVKPFALLLQLLRDRIRMCTSACADAIWLTNASKAYKKRYVNPRLQSSYMRDLIRITTKTTHENTLMAAYTMLGNYDERSVLPTIIRALSKRQGARPFILSNRISWLQGFGRSVQVRALRQLVANAQNSDVLKAANRRLRYLTRRKP